MYPKSKFNRRNLIAKGVISSEIPFYLECANDIGNLQLLPANANIVKQNKDFDVWLREEYQTKEEMKQYQSTHWLPSDQYSYYTYSNYLNFISQRKKLMKFGLKKILLS